MPTYRLKLSRTALFRQTGCIEIEAPTENEARDIFFDIDQDDITHNLEDGQVIDTGESEDWEVERSWMVKE